MFFSPMKNKAYSTCQGSQEQTCVYLGRQTRRKQQQLAFYCSLTRLKRFFTTHKYNDDCLLALFSDTLSIGKF